MANNQNTMRDMKRSILKAVRDSQKTKQDAMDEYVAARVNIKSWISSQVRWVRKIMQFSWIPIH